jgi:hypothetical protein
MLVLNRDGRYVFVAQVTVRKHQDTVERTADMYRGLYRSRGGRAAHAQEGVRV